jgi:prepilin-type N-terminal cleavage/methylation domain-containing protein
VPKLKKAGFSLLEMSVVLVIIGLVVGGGITLLVGSVEKNQQELTIRRIEAIQQSLLHFRRAFNRLPCPADATLAISNDNFGVEAAKLDPTLATCRGSAPSANYVDASTNIDSGMVPTRALGLADDFAFDGWGRRIIYVVDNRATVQNAFTTITISDSTARITIEQTTGSSKNTRAIYALLSHGENGHGAFARNGGSTRVTSGSTNTDEQRNCDCNASATPSSPDYTPLVQKIATQSSTSTTDVFDDIVRFGTRQDLRTSYE